MAKLAQSVLIIEARFYDDITNELARGATEELRRRGIGFERISVPGALEVPVALSMAVNSKIVGPKGRHDGCVALGCVIRGETSHYDIVAAESARGLLDIAVNNSIAVGNGILTVDTREQAWARASVDGRNKGASAAIACATLLELAGDLERKSGR
ncbi:MAG: 6,7-dimethyl-8-ribityllumazine synthase [Hyphomicrobiaceae bacterium]|nr:6,7-dimethyl-8-ribityllumazine synthase [Hyphomicrobiaceae bacterium]